jgi:hypothetical protein
VRRPILQTDQVVASSDVAKNVLMIASNVALKVMSEHCLFLKIFIDASTLRVEEAVLSEHLEVGICFALKKRLKLERPTRITYLVLFEGSQGQSFV